MKIPERKLLAPKPLYKRSFAEIKNIFLNRAPYQRKRSIFVHSKRSLDRNPREKLERSPSEEKLAEVSTFQKMKEFVGVLLVAGSCVLSINLITILLLFFTFFLAHRSSAATCQKARQIYILGMIGIVIFSVFICVQIYFTIAVFAQGVVDSPGTLKNFVESMGVLASPTSSQNALDISICFLADLLGFFGLIWLRRIYKKRMEDGKKEVINPPSIIFCIIELIGMLISGAFHQSISGALLTLLAFYSIYSWSINNQPIQTSKRYYVISMCSVITGIIFVVISGLLKTPLLSNLLSVQEISCFNQQRDIISILAYCV